MTPKSNPPPDADGEGLRLNRYLARAGYGSRRGVETLVNERRVAINGEVVTDLARRVDPTRDDVRVDGMPVDLPQDFRVYAFHKPVGVVSTMRSQGGQQSLVGFALRASIPGRFKPVGRLDADSGGLLLWTDDGDLGQALLKPKSEVWKRYEVELAKVLAPNAEKMLAAGKIVLDGYPVLRCKVHPDPDGDRRRWTLELHEGRKRQIRRMMAAVGAKVVILTRTAIGPVELGRLHEGDFRRLGHPEEEALRKAAGLLGS
jgi:23S rRNA pseudouridine2605 synthase